MDFYFDSIPDDTGISLGAGSYYYKKKTGIVPTIPKDTFFHHVSYDLKGISGKRVSARDIARFIASCTPKQVPIALASETFIYIFPLNVIHKKNFKAE